MGGDVNVFESQTDLCLHLEHIKLEKSFDTYIETIVWFCENESDIPLEEFAKELNKTIIDHIEVEARAVNMFKDKEPLVTLF